MRIAMINGSPKVKESNSQYLLTELKKLVEEHSEILELTIKKSSLRTEEFDALYACDALVFAFPLYVDGIPSHLLHFLVEFQNYFNSKESKPITVYALMNCGFYEGTQNHLAIEMMKNWCQRAGLAWGQGVGTGAGEMLGPIKSVPLGKGPKKNLGKALNALAENILNGAGGENIFISPNFPRFAFKFSAHLWWNSQARTNGLTKRDLSKK